MAYRLIGMIWLGLAACSPSAYWFETESWFDDRVQSSEEEDRPNYIPLAAVPDVESEWPLRILNQYRQNTLQKGEEGKGNVTKKDVAKKDVAKKDVDGE